MQEVKYDPTTRKMTATSNGQKANGRSQAGITWYQIPGKVKETLLQFAREDGLDMTGSNPRGDSMLEGRACNIYIAQAVADFIEARKASDAKAAEAKVQEPPKAPAQKPAEAQKPTPKPAPKLAAPVAA